jgi:hypothetical protein
MRSGTESLGGIMRKIIILGIFAASFAAAGEPDYTEVRELSTQAGGATEFRIDAGAGSLEVTGVDGLDSVEVTATIGVDNVRDDDKARELLDKHLKLELERRGDEVVLVSDFGGSMWRGGREAWVQLVVRMPADVALNIDDGSGSITIDNVRAAVRVDDGSGSIKISNVGPLEIDDGSGSIVAEDVSGDVDIIDGSGSITVAGVSGTVTIDDGSGSINVRDVQQDLKIEDAGSGSVNIKNVQGSVETDS